MRIVCYPGGWKSKTPGSSSARCFQDKKKEPPRAARSSTLAIGSTAEAGTDLGEGAVHLLAQEGQDQDHDYGDEDQNKSVLYQALAFLLHLLDLSAHVICLQYV